MIISNEKHSIRKNLLLLSEMTSFEFSLGGFSGTSHFVFIDGKRNNKEIRYAKTPGGRYAYLKHTNNGINLDTDIKKLMLLRNHLLDFK